MSASSGMTQREALALLGLAAPAAPEVVKAAFKQAVKAARPDPSAETPESTERFRKVIEAYRLLQRLDAAKAALAAFRAAPRPSGPPVLEITVAEALSGLAREIRLPGGARVAVRLPAGLRNDDSIRLRGKGEAGQPLLMRVRIASEPNRAVVGNDLWLTAEVDPRALAEGGRVEIDTPRGPRAVWIPKGFPPDGKLRLAGEGLPARGDKPTGDLFLKPVAGVTLGEAPFVARRRFG
jgi:curved DNA-binding protein